MLNWPQLSLRMKSIVNEPEVFRLCLLLNVAPACHDLLSLTTRKVNSRTQWLCVKEAPEWLFAETKQKNIDEYCIQIILAG